MLLFCGLCDKFLIQVPVWHLIQLILEFLLAHRNKYKMTKLVKSVPLRNKE